MAENFNTQFAATRQARGTSEVDAMKADMARWAAEDAAAAAAPKPAVAPAAAPAAPKSSPGVVSESLKAVGGGIADAGRNAINMVDDAATWLDNNLIDLRFNSESFGRTGGAAVPHKEGLQVPALPEWAQNKTTAGKIGRSVVQFLVPFLGATKFLKGTAALGGALPGMTNVAARGATAGAAVDFATFDPTEKRLSNLILDATDQDPMFGKAILDFLATNPNDAKAEGRFKQTLEGFGIGMAVEGTIKGVKAFRAHFAAKGLNNATDAIVAAKEARTAEALVKDATKGPELSLVDQIDLVNTSAKRTPKSAEASADVFTNPKADDLTTSGSFDSLTPTTPGKLADEAADSILQRPGATEMSLEGGARAGDSIPYPVAREEFPFPEQMRLAEEKTVHRAILDTDGTIAFTKDAPGSGQIDFETVAKAALELAPHARTATDLIALRAYRQLQEAAAASIIKPGESVAQAIEVAASGGTGKRAITHKLRKQIREDAAQAGAKATDEVAQPAATGAPATAPAKAPKAKKEAPEMSSAEKASDAPRPIAKGDTVHYGDSSGEVISLPSKKGGKFMVRDDATGKVMGVTPDVMDPLMADIKANARIINEASGRKGQGGFISPGILANMIAGQAGGVTGYMSADDDASFAEKLSLAGMGVLAGLGVKVGAQKVFTKNQRAAIAAPHPEAVQMARKEFGNVAPISDAVKAGKKVPTIHRSQVDTMVKAATSGGYKGLAAELKKADFNFDRIDTPGDVKDLINSFSSVFEKQMTVAKHGKQSFADMAELADELGAGATTMKEMYQGTDNLGARILAHRALLTASAEKIQALIPEASTGAEQAMLSLRKHVAFHATMQAQMKGVQTEVARALAQFRITARSVDLAVNERSALLDAMGGHAANVKFARALAGITDPKQLNAALRIGAMARSQNAITEMVVMAKLWSPVTHMANTVGNALTALFSPAERYAAHLIGTYVRRDPNAITSGEVKAQLYGMVAGIGDALKITADGFRALKQAGGEALHGEFKAAAGTLGDNAEEFGTVYRSVALDAPIGRNSAQTTLDPHSGVSHAISAEAFNLDPKEWLGILTDTLGTATRMPGRALGASDELFWAIHQRGELHALAYRDARARGLEGQASIDHIAKTLLDPDPSMRAQAAKAAQDGTFTSPLKGAGANISKLLNGGIGPVQPGRLIVPFIRTPWNIFKYVGERTPVLNLATDAWRADWAAGGIARDQALAKLVTGSTLLGFGAMMAAGAGGEGQGDWELIGGGEFKQSSEKLGKRLPYSLRYKDQYYAFNRLDPMGMFLGLAVDFKDILGNFGDDDVTAGQLTSAASLAVGRNVMSKTFLSGIVELVEAFSESRKGNDRAMEQWFNNQTAASLPFNSAFNVDRKINDPMAREVWTLMDAIKNKTRWSTDLYPALNLFGEEVPHLPGFGSDIASPIRTSVATTQPAAAEIARLNIDMQHPPRTLPGKHGGPGIDLSQKQYHRLLQLQGAPFRDALTEMVTSDWYKQLPEGDINSPYVDVKEKVIKLMHSRYNQAGVAALLEEDKALMAAYEQNSENAGLHMQGKPVIPLAPQQ